MRKELKEEVKKFGGICGEYRKVKNKILWLKFLLKVVKDRIDIIDDLIIVIK